MSRRWAPILVVALGLAGCAAEPPSSAPGQDGLRGGASQPMPRGLRCERIGSTVDC